MGINFPYRKPSVDTSLISRWHSYFLNCLFLSLRYKRSKDVRKPRHLAPRDRHVRHKTKCSANVGGKQNRQGNFIKHLILMLLKLPRIKINMIQKIRAVKYYFDLVYKFLDKLVNNSFKTCLTTVVPTTLSFQFNWYFT